MPSLYLRQLDRPLMVTSELTSYIWRLIRPEVLEVLLHIPPITDLLLEDVLLVEEEDYGDRPQPPVVPDALK